jgi:hypothetical protein
MLAGYPPKIFALYPAPRTECRCMELATPGAMAIRYSGQFAMDFVADLTAEAATFVDHRQPRRCVLTH